MLSKCLFRHWESRESRGCFVILSVRGQVSVVEVPVRSQFSLPGGAAVCSAVNIESAAVPPLPLRKSTGAKPGMRLVK